jgi:hypothetical protein
MLGNIYSAGSKIEVNIVDRSTIIDVLLFYKLIEDTLKNY